MNKDNEEYLINELLRYYNQYNKVPTLKDFTNNDEFPSTNRYRKVFKTWSAALKRSNLVNELNIPKHEWEKYEGIKNDYLSGMPLGEIADKYGYGNGTAISPIINRLGIKQKFNKWTKEQISLLTEIYSTEPWESLIEKLSPFRKEDIITKAYKLGIKREDFYWSDKELEILKESYENGIPPRIIKDLIPSKSVQSISVKANKLGLSAGSIWTEEEIEEFKKLYPDNNNKELSKIFNRTIPSIQTMGTKILSLKKSDKYLSSFRKEFTKEQLIKLLSGYAKSLGRTPQHFEVTDNEDMPGIVTYHRYFGSYTQACKKAGLEPNNRIYGNTEISVTYSSNGDICLSNSELIITDLLIKNKIRYEKEIYYRDLINDERCGLKRCDWLLNDEIIVEFFGMPDKDFYKIKMEEKIKLCEDHGLALISLYPKDLNYNLKGLKSKLSEYINIEEVE